jgi:hypothetical protein
MRSSKKERIAEGPPERESYPSLMDMVDGYFHQDYDIVSEDPDEVVAYVKSVNSKAYVQQLILDVEHFLAKYGQSDSELDEAFIRVFAPGINFRYLKDRTARQALEKVVEILSNPTKTE